MAAMRAANAVVSHLDSLAAAGTTVASKLKLMRVALLCIAISEAYDVFSDCAWVKDISTRWSLYVISTEASVYGTAGGSFYGGASDYMATYVRSPDTGLLGWPCNSNGTSYYAGGRSSTYGPYDQRLWASDGVPACFDSFITGYTKTPGEDVCIKLRYFYSEPALQAYMRASGLPGSALIGYTRSLGSATLYDVFPNATTGFFDDFSYIRVTVPCSTPLPTSSAVSGRTACGQDFDAVATPNYYSIRVFVPMTQFVLPNAVSLLRSSDSCALFNSIFNGTMVIFALTCVLLLGKLARHLPNVWAALRARGRGTEVSAEDAKRRAISLAEVPFFCLLTVPFLMTKADIATVHDVEDAEAEHSLWSRMIGTHRSDSLLTARYLPGTLLFKASLSQPGRAQLPAGKAGLTLCEAILYVVCVPFSPLAVKLLYGWTAQLPLWKRVLGAPLICVIHSCAFTAQMFSLASLGVLIIFGIFLGAVNVAVYGDQKITLRLFEDLPQLVITALFTAKVEKNTAAVVSMAANVLMMILQTAKDLYYSARAKQRRGAAMRTQQLAAYTAARARYDELRAAAAATQLSAPAAQQCCGCNADADVKAALAALRDEEAVIEAEPCECTAYAECGGTPCTSCGRPCCSNPDGSPCCCCGAPCCVPGVRSWASQLTATYPDLTTGELLHLCFVTPLYIIVALLPPFLFIMLWRFSKRRVPDEPAEKAAGLAPAGVVDYSRAEPPYVKPPYVEPPYERTEVAAK